LFAPALVAVGDWPRALFMNGPVLAGTMPHSDPDRSVLLAASGEIRFDVSQMAADSDRANRKVAWIGIGVAAGAAVLLALFAVIFVLAGYTYATSFVVLTVLFGLLILVGLYVYQFAHVPRSPTSVSVGPKGVSFSYPGATPRTVSWGDPGNLVWLLDQRGRISRKFIIGSDLGCRIKGGRRVVGGVGFSPISLAAFDAILAQGREQGLRVDSHSLNLGRGVVAKDVTIHRMFRPRG